MRMIAVAIDATDSEFSIVSRTAVMDWPYTGTFTAARPYDVADDGRFLAITLGGGSGEQPRIIIVQNWLEELERLVPTQ